jgi:hypothetical protein
VAGRVDEWHKREMNDGEEWGMTGGGRRHGKNEEIRPVGVGWACWDVSHLEEEDATRSMPQGI